MANYTSITLTGRLGSEPTSYGTTTQSICTFRLGSSRGYYDRARQAWKEQPTTWVTVKTYRNLAANVSKCLHKGDPVIVSGYLITEEWADRRTGERRSVNVIEATSVGHDISQGISLFSRLSQGPRFEGRRRDERENAQNDGGPSSSVEQPARDIAQPGAQSTDPGTSAGESTWPSTPGTQAVGPSQTQHDPVQGPGSSPVESSEQMGVAAESSSSNGDALTNGGERRNEGNVGENAASSGLVNEFGEESGPPF